MYAKIVLTAKKAGVDLRCGAGRLGFNSHSAIKYTPHRVVRGIFYGGDGGS